MMTKNKKRIDTIIFVFLLSTTLSIILLVISWALSHFISWILDVCKIDYNLSLWTIFIILLSIFLVIILCSFMKSKSKITNKGKLWDHEMEMYDIESYTGKNYDLFSDPYDDY
jgi:hypothetical protein